MSDFPVIISPSLRDEEISPYLGLRCQGLIQETPELEPGRVQAIHLMVSGRVQGVGFRWFTEREALRRGVNGYVRNLANGGVEIRAQADGATLAAFRAAIERGPSAARVDSVDARPVPVDETLSSFQVRF